MDKEHADFERVYGQIKERLTPKVIPVEIPVGEGAEFHGIINLFSQKCHLYKKGTKAGEYEEVDVPGEYRTRFEQYSKELIERIAETDDTLLERYLGGGEIGRDEAIAAMKAGMAKGELFPLFCGAAELTYGMRALLAKLVELCPAPLQRPVITEAIDVQQRGEEEKLSNGLHKLHEEDPTFQHEYSGELGQTLIRGLGERHLEIIVGRLARKFGVHAHIGRPKIAYRETFRARAEGQGKHKKQTGGRGQYGDCWIRIAPLPRGSGFQFVDEIVGGVIPRQYIPAVERGIEEAAARGPVAGYAVGDL